LATTLARFSLLAGVILLLSNPFVAPRTHGWLSALPLLLAGLAFALLQVRLRPAPGVLFKRLLLAAAFIGWGVDQLLPPGRIALFLGDAVIALYVLDLFWLSSDQLREN
jgi:hypothetical protein